MISTTYSMVIGWSPALDCEFPKGRTDFTEFCSMVALSVIKHTSTGQAQIQKTWGMSGSIKGDLCHLGA